MSEKCIRCGNAGVDRRTLWMACLYDMSELDVPFEKNHLYSISCADNGCGKIQPKEMFTLRVCKRCRSEWMDAIQRWFHADPKGVDHDADEEQPSESCGSGIFIRDKGAIREVTREEWAIMQKQKDMVLRKED